MRLPTGALRRAAAVLVAAVSVSLTGDAQGPAPARVPSSGAISGVVVDGSTNRPVAGALVYLGREGREIVTRQTRQFTDEHGRFAFTGVPPFDRYSLSVSKDGYFDGGYSRDTMLPPGSTNRLTTVAEGEWVGNLRIALWRPAVMAGTVVDEAGEPVVGVSVRVITEVRAAGRSQPAVGPSTHTDDRGMYRITGLPPGRYRVTVPSVQASVPSSLTTTDIVGRGARAGTVEHALDLDPDARLVLSGFPIPPPPIDGRTQMYPTAFHGGDTLADAAGIDLQYGDERDNLDITLHPVDAGSIAGRVETAEAVAPGTLVRLLATGFEDLGSGSETGTARLAADGTFTFLNVPAGRYIVDVPLMVSEYQASVPFITNGMQMAPPGMNFGGVSNTVDSGPLGATFMTRHYGDRARYWGRVAVTIGSTTRTNVVLPLVRAGSITGRMIAERDPARPAEAGPSFMAVTAEPADGRASLGMVQPSTRPNAADGQFQITELAGGRYVLRGVAGAGWVIKSVTWRGADVTDTGFDASSGGDFSGVVVTFTRRAPILMGIVRNARMEPLTDATVVAFPTDRAQWVDYGMTPWRIKSIAVSNGGAFRFANLPAGDYYVAAVPGSDPSVWIAPDFFTTMAARAARVRLDWGEERSQDLQVVER